jgi:pyruvate formate lyase activating enzyme
MPIGAFSVNAKRATDPVAVAGLTRLTTIDLPGRLAAVVYLQGCPWRCGYCHNADLQPRTQGALAWQDVLAWLDTRRGLLDGVVFSGGEPTLQAGLAQAIATVREMGFQIGLHTAGIYPERLRQVLPLLDWVGFDIKAARADYDRITGVTGSAERAWRSAGLLLDSGVEHEFRTTVHPDLIAPSQLLALTQELAVIGARHFVLQHCVLRHCADANLRYHNRPRPSQKLLDDLAQPFDRFEIRDAA